MAEHVVGGLKWVKSEVVGTLRRIRRLLEDDHSAGDRGVLLDAADAFGEIRGVMLALQLTLPARLLEEMQRLAEAIADGAVRVPHESLEALILALIQLPDYLNRLEVGVEALPLGLWPIINDLRASRGLPPVTEAELLVPASVLVEEDDELALEARQAVTAALRQARMRFHTYLLEWYRQDSEIDAVTKLRYLFRQLDGYLQDGTLADLFRLADLYAASVETSRIPNDSIAYAQIARLDRVLKQMAQDPFNSRDADARDLVVELIHAIGEAGVVSVVADELRARYGASLSSGAPAGESEDARGCSELASNGGDPDLYPGLDKV